MKEISKFIYLRHGQTFLDGLKKLPFQSDILLDIHGKRQSALAAEILINNNLGPYYLQHSLSIQASKTSEIISKSLMKHDERLGKGLSFKPKNKCYTSSFSHDGLAECYGGILDGLYTDNFLEKAKKLNLEGEDIWDNLELFCPEAENIREVSERNKQAVKLGYTTACNSNSTLVVIGHFGAMRALARFEMGLDFKPKNAIPYLFQNINGFWSVKPLLT